VELGPQHRDTLGSMGNLARMLQDQGSFDEAEELYRRALSGQESKLGSDHPDTITNISRLVVFLMHSLVCPARRSPMACE